jgi:hypothetical protein
VPLFVHRAIAKNEGAFASESENFASGKDTAALKRALRAFNRESRLL